MQGLGLFSGLLLLTSLIVSPAFADSVQYTITGTFGPTADAAPLSGPNGTYSIAFSLPQTPTPDYFDSTAGDFALNNVPINYSFHCDGCATATPFTGTADVVDFGMANSGSTLIVEFLTSGPDHSYYWQFAGDQLFSGTVEQPTLEDGGSLNLATGGIFELDSGDFINVGNATISAQVVSTPEPSSLALLLAALGALGLLAYFRVSRA
jgi:PEP-CTERM motif